MKLVTPFLEHSCERCGSCNEAKFVHAGPHIKQICIDCGAYVKFYPASKIPDVKEIKQKIFFMMDGDIAMIEAAKTTCEFIPNQSGIDNKIQYWKLYLHLRKDHAL